MSYVQITSKVYSDETLLDFVAYNGQGVIYAVVMRLTNGSHQLPNVAAYVPAVTYSCNYTVDHCEKRGEFISTSPSQDISPYCYVLFVVIDFIIYIFVISAVVIVNM